MRTTVSALRIVLLFICTALIINIANASDSTVFNSPNRQVNLIQNELNRLLQLEQNGGWQKIILPQKFYMKEQTDPSIKILKQRLHASGDLTETDTSSVFTPELQKAVMKIQKQFGQKP